MFVILIMCVLYVIIELKREIYCLVASNSVVITRLEIRERKLTRERSGRLLNCLLCCEPVIHGTRKLHRQYRVADTKTRLCVQDRLGSRMSKERYRSYLSNK